MDPLHTVNTPAIFNEIAHSYAYNWMFWPLDGIIILKCQAGNIKTCINNHIETLYLKHSLTPMPSKDFYNVNMIRNKFLVHIKWL